MRRFYQLLMLLGIGLIGLGSSLSLSRADPQPGDTRNNMTVPNAFCPTTGDDPCELCPNALFGCDARPNPNFNWVQTSCNPGTETMTCDFREYYCGEEYLCADPPIPFGTCGWKAYCN